MRGLLISLAGWLMGTAAALGQRESPPSVYLRDSDEAVKLLNVAEAELRAERWEAAARLLREATERFGDRLVPVTFAADGTPQPASAPSLVYWGVGTFGQRRLARLPTIGRARLADLADPTAAGLWAQTQEEEQADPERLWRQLIATAPASRYVPAALDRLADRAVAQGRLSEALRHWDLLLPAGLRGADESKAGPSWVYGVEEQVAGAAPAQSAPGQPPPTSVPRVAAKRIAALLLAGRQTDAAVAARRLAQAYPDATAPDRLAGRIGTYAAIAAELVQQAESWAPAVTDPHWPTFAGSSERSRQRAAPLAIRGSNAKQWRFPVPERRLAGNVFDTEPDAAPPVATRYYPAVVGDRAFVLLDWTLWTIDLARGSAESWPTETVERTSLLDPTQLLTATRTHLLFHVGGRAAPQVTNHLRASPPQVESTLYCYDHRTRKLAWKLSAARWADGSTLFEGAPVVLGDRVYIAATRVDAMHETQVLCLDLQDGQTIWRTSVCESSPESTRGQTPPACLLTASDDTLYLSTNHSAIAALDADNGRVQWVATYPSAQPLLAAWTTPRRGPAPALYAAGRLYVAPIDTTKVFALDAVTGQFLWQTDQQVWHLLGVHGQHLIATGYRVHWLDIGTGASVQHWPENVPAVLPFAANIPQLYGRGLLAGAVAYWPTPSTLYRIDLATGHAAYPPLALRDQLGLFGGNLIPAGEQLLLTQPDRLVSLSTIAQELRVVEETLQVRGPDPTLQWRAAELIAEAGDLATALARARQALALLPPAAGDPLAPVVDGVPLRERVMQTIARMLVKQWDALPAAAAERSAVALQLQGDPALLAVPLAQEEGRSVSVRYHLRRPTLGKLVLTAAAPAAASPSAPAASPENAASAWDLEPLWEQPGRLLPEPEAGYTETLVLLEALEAERVAVRAVAAATGVARWRLELPQPPKAYLDADSVGYLLVGDELWAIAPPAESAADAPAASAAVPAPRVLWRQPIQPTGSSAGWIPDAAGASGVLGEPWASDSQVALLDGDHLVVLADGVLGMFQRSDGHWLWRVELPRDSGPWHWLRVTPAGLVVASLRQVRLLDAATGVEQWAHVRSGCVAVQEPVLIGSMLYLADRRGRLAALDLQAKVVQWTAATGLPESDPTRLAIYPAHPERLYLQRDGHRVWMVAAADGQTTWERSLGFFPFFAPATPFAWAGDYLLLPTPNRLQALVASTGAPAWERPWPAAGTTTLLPIDDSAVLAARAEESTMVVEVIDAASGQSRSRQLRGDLAGVRLHRLAASGTPPRFVYGSSRVVGVLGLRQAAAQTRP